MIFMLAFTSFLTKGAGIFSSKGKCTADFVVAYPASSVLCDFVLLEGAGADLCAILKGTIITFGEILAYRICCKRTERHRRLRESWKLVKSLRVKEMIVEGESAFALVNYDLLSPKGSPFLSTWLNSGK
jgi:hypothetical protein